MNEGAFDMYFDFNHPVAVEGASLDLADKYERFATAIKLGYTTIAHNHVIHACIGDDHKWVISSRMKQKVGGGGGVKIESSMLCVGCLFLLVMWLVFFVVIDINPGGHCHCMIQVGFYASLQSVSVKYLHV